MSLRVTCAGQPRISPNSRGKTRKPSSKDLASVLRCSVRCHDSFRAITAAAALAVLYSDLANSRRAPPQSRGYHSRTALGSAAVAPLRRIDRPNAGCGVCRLPCRVPAVGDQRALHARSVSAGPPAPPPPPPPQQHATHPHACARAGARVRAPRLPRIGARPLPPPPTRAIAAHCLAHCLAADPYGRGLARTCGAVRCDCGSHRFTITPVGLQHEWVTQPNAPPATARRTTSAPTSAAAEALPVEEAPANEGMLA